MKAIICGGRDFFDIEHAFLELDAFHADFSITTVIQGGAGGADHIAKLWACSRMIPMIEHKARWRELGKRAGSERNKFMLEHESPGCVIAFHGGTGTAHMKRIAKEAGIKVYEL